MIEQVSTRKLSVGAGFLCIAKEFSFFEKRRQGGRNKGRNKNKQHEEKTVCQRDSDYKKQKRKVIAPVLLIHS